jgi:phenylalanyl-tRNA synthetase alpha chain
LDSIEKLKQQFDSEIVNAKTNDEVEKLRISFLGKKGAVTDLLKALKEMDASEKKVFGMHVNELKGYIEKQISDKKQFISEQEYIAKIN